jgi:ABC-2 type transport system permease protein
MRHIYEVFRYEFTRNVRRKGFLFTTFGLPLIGFVLAFGYNAIQSLQQPEEQDVNDILNQFDFEGLQQAGLVDTAGIFPSISEPLQEILIPYETQDMAQAALRAGQIDAYYVISPDYMETGSVTLVVPSLSISRITSQPVQQLFYTTFASDIDPALLNRLRSPITFDILNIQLSQDAVTDTDANFLMLYIFVLVFLLGMFMTNGYLLQSVIEEKENRVIEVLITSLRSTELLSGKILAFGLLGIIQIVVWGAAIVALLAFALSLPAFQTMSVLLNIRIPTDQFPLMFLYFVFGYLLFAGVYGAVGAISNSMREGPSYAAIFTLPAALPFYFFAIFQATPNAPVPVFLSIFPLTAPISMMMRLSSTPVPTDQIIISLVLLAASAGGMMWFAGRIFRVNSLLSGKVPKLRDIPNLLRG